MSRFSADVFVIFKKRRNFNYFSNHPVFNSLLKVRCLGLWKCGDFFEIWVLQNILFFYLKTIMFFFLRVVCNLKLGNFKFILYKVIQQKYFTWSKNLLNVRICVSFCSSVDPNIKKREDNSFILIFCVLRKTKK